MKLQNKQFGEIEFNDEAVLTFDEGILGFEELKNFLLFSEKDGYFFWLISVDEPEIIFPLFSLKMLNDEYSSEEKMEPYGIVKLDKEPEKITINLKAPVFIDHEQKKGYQKLIDNEECKVDYPLFVYK